MKTNNIILIVVISVCLSALDASFILTKIIATLSIAAAFYLLIKDIKHGEKEWSTSKMGKRKPFIYKRSIQSRFCITI